MLSLDLSRYSGKKILVIGLGISGRSAARFLHRRGAHIVGTDRNRELLNTDKDIAELLRLGVKISHDSEPLDVTQFDLIVTSPGAPPTHPYIAQALTSGIEVIGEVELACRSMSHRCLAVTGTNGKTTVTLLVTHVLNSAGMKAIALGNVGTPLTWAIDEVQEGSLEIFVVELSSFQLDTLQARFVDAGVILNVTPDHLDRYGTLEAYAKSKLHLHDCLKPNGKLLVEDRCYQFFSSLFVNSQCLLYGYRKECHIHTDTHHIYVKNTDSFTLPQNYQGKASHDVENIMAAYALCREVGVTNEQFLSALQTFQKPSHRIEFVRTIDGVHFYDDSKGTNLDAVVRAVQSLDGNIVLIAGGVDKGAPYTLWLDSIAKKLKFICAIGKAAQKIKKDLGQHIPVELFSSLSDAVTHAAKVSKAGDIVLLSPGCASYDMFRDYVHRGEEFQRIVRAL